ncbi:MAG: excinuclease ABC subunit UvrA [Bacteroidales bacterium]
MDKDKIIIKGARVNNLKNIDVTIPHNKLIVITGLSGSGKTSLAFDTLFAEGQRRYVESLSSYARQFLGRMNKPEVDSISGISPAIAVEQKTSNRNPRSTVGTTTEIYEYLKLLYARIGKTYSPISGEEVTRHSVTNVVDALLAFEEGTRVNILCPIKLKVKEPYRIRFELLMQLGYLRVMVDGEIMRIDEAIQKTILKSSDVRILIDRISIVHNSEDVYLRLSDSVHTAFYEGEGECIVVKDDETLYFSNRFERDGMEFTKPSENFFAFNNPYGACPKCSGSGMIEGISEDLVITQPNLSVYDGVVNCWRGEIMKKFKEDFIEKAADVFPIHRPYNKLSEKDKDLLWHGTEEIIGIDKFFDIIIAESYKIQFRVMLSRYKGRTTCPDCRGTRLRKDAGYVKINQKSIIDLVLMPIDDLILFFNNIELTQYEQQVTERLITEIKQRLGYLKDVGLGYLTLNRQSSTLSGGESQRISLATSLGSPLVGSMYILDEPSIGLHARDTQNLLNVLYQLRDLGNTVIVVEHDEEIIKAADYIIDIGPEAGVRGGEVVFSGKSEDLLKANNSLTAKYINQELIIPLPKRRRKWKESIIIENCNENNLKDITLKIPLQALTVVCGVSGSGKTTLIKKIFYNSILMNLGEVVDNVPKASAPKGSLSLIKAIQMVDQNPIGRSSRSNPATYLGAFDDIRNLFAMQPLAKKRNLKPGYFSFNVDGGRCEECKGEGVVTIPMQFMADVVLPCQACNGSRYKEDALEILYRGKSVADILALTIEEALEFFSQDDQVTTIKIVQKLQSLIKVGLGYLQLGQSSTTISGGEAQRIKLAFYLTKGNNEKPTIFIFDEPSTGLHFHDINKLNIALQELVNIGHTVIVIEHHADIIKIADWVIELGPEGGNKGGEITFEGTPEELAKAENTQTGKYIRSKV